MNLGVIWTTYEIGLAHNVGEVEQDGRWSKRSHFRKTISPLGHFFLSPLFFFFIKAPIMKSRAHISGPSLSPAPLPAPQQFFKH